MGVMMQTGDFYCPSCGKTWSEELPPMWTMFDFWPTCCGIHASLLTVPDLEEILAALRAPRLS